MFSISQRATETVGYLRFFRPGASLPNGFWTCGSRSRVRAIGEGFSGHVSEWDSVSSSIEVEEQPHRVHGNTARRRSKNSDYRRQPRSHVESGSEGPGVLPSRVDNQGYGAGETMRSYGVNPSRFGADDPVRFDGGPLRTKEDVRHALTTLFGTRHLSVIDRCVDKYSIGQNDAGPDIICCHAGLTRGREISSTSDWRLVDGDERWARRPGCPRTPP